MIRKGNNKFKTLHKGSELITRVFKGDELIYQDIDALYSFKFTIDTRKNQSGGTTTNKTFAFSFNNVHPNRNVTYYDPVLIEWGDGTSTTTVDPGVNQYNVSVSHTYSTAGEYQIKILPTVFEHGVPRAGWLSGINLVSSDSNSLYQLLSVDKILPEGSYTVTLGSTSSVNERAHSNVPNFTNARNLRRLPVNLYKNVIVLPGQASSFSSKFNNFFFYCSYNTPAANFECDFPATLKVFLDKIDTTGVKDFSQCFYSTFRFSKIGTIPAGLFSHIDTSAGTNLSHMFNGTFAYSYNGSTDSTIPAGLFDTIDTSEATSATSMFSETFFQAFGKEFNQGSKTVTVPDRLLPLNFPKVTGSGAENLFSYTFSTMPMAENLSIPEHIFDGLYLPNITSAKGMFAGIFSGWYRCISGIPANLFSNVTISPNITSTQEMFKRTFSRFEYNYTNNVPLPATTNSIPAGLFSFLDTSNVTNFSSMFSNTFEDCMQGTSTTATIPEGLLDFLDTSNATNVTSIFYFMFAGYGNRSTVGTIPATLFAHFDTSGVTNLSSVFTRMFSSCFQDNTTATIPAGLFDYMDTSNVTSFGSTFSEMFSSFGKNSTVATIPANLFSYISFANATSCASTFSSTFSNYGYENTTGQIPATLFSTFVTPNCANMNGTFSDTFSYCFYKSTVVTIPDTIFSMLSTANVTNFSYMFKGTFAHMCRYSTTMTALGNIFSNVNTSSGTIFSYMFQTLFYQSFRPPYPITIPATLFSTINTSGATTVASMFTQTFDMAAITEVPQGILGGITVAGTHTSTFYSTFGCQSYSQLVGDYVGMTLNDPFYGMTDFSWASASDTTALTSMFQTGNRNGGRQRYQWLTGSASTVLQHFNFTPASDTNMFQWQDQLTDYSTINANWK